MYNEEVGGRQYQRPENKIANQINSRALGGASSGQGKVSHSPGHWKKYISSETNLKSPKRRQSQNDRSKNAQERVDMFEREPSGIQENQMSKLEQQKRRKQDMMRRVEEIQKKVNPILKNQRNEAADENFGWTNRMEQRILKLETNIDSIEKEMQIKIEKRLLEVERQWNSKIQYLLETHQEKVNNWETRNGRYANNRSSEAEKQRFEEQRSNRKYSRPEGYQQNSQNYRSSYLYQQGTTKQPKAKVEGFFTKREHQNQEVIDDHI